MKNKTARARELRRLQPRSEAVLWNALRNRQLDGFKFRRQAPIERYFADFACVDARLVVELDGWSHGMRAAHDIARTAVLERCGFHVLRFANEDVAENLEGVLETIRLALRPAP